MGTVSTAIAIRISRAAFFIFSPRNRIGHGAGEKIDGYKEIEAKANDLLGKGSKSPGAARKRSLQNSRILSFSTNCHLRT
jgi:hypothetical protein